MKAQVMTKAWEIYRGYNYKSMSFWSRSLKEAWNYVRYDNRKISEIEIPKGGEIHVPSSNTVAGDLAFKSRYAWNYEQLKEWKEEMIAQWGDVTLTIWNCNNGLVRYEATGDFLAHLEDRSQTIDKFVNS